MRKMPWHDKQGRAKAIAVFATILLVSLGLCGVNIVAVMTMGDRMGSLLTWTAIIGAFGLRRLWLDWKLWA
jgi:hypothetical protein